MRENHLSPEDLDRILAGDSLIRDRLLLHHLAVCADCRSVGGDILDLYLSGEIGLELCVIEIGLARSRREAPALVAELRALPFEEAKALLGKDPRFKSWGLAELLGAESECEASGDAKHSAELAELAVETSMALGEWEPAERHWHDELRALAWAYLANARRVIGDLSGAREAFAVAESFWTPAYEDVGDVLGYEARFFALKASLRRAERRLDESFVLLDQALAANPSPALRVSILINKAKAYEELGGMDEALDILEEARREGSEVAEGRLRLCLEQNFLDYLSKAGRFAEAEAAYEEIWKLATELGSQVDRLRLWWTRARIVEGLGEFERAASILEQVREEFAELELWYDAVLSSLELALMRAKLGQRQEALSALRESLPILQVLNVEREGLLAVCIIAQAVENGRLTAELISQALDLVRRERERPAL